MSGILEIIAVVTALLYVFFAAREKPVCFLFGFLSSVIYIYITYVAKYYFDTFINAYYVVMSVYGWIHWKQPGNGQQRVITSWGTGKFIGVIVGGITITVIFGWVSSLYTDASLPYIDGFTTVFALIATWMVVKKYLENWLIWIVVDAIGVGMYWWKNLYLTAGLYFVYTIIALIGYMEWKRKMKKAV